MNLQSPVTGAYSRSEEHLADELAKLDALLQLQVLRFQAFHSDKKFDEFAGLYLAAEEIARLLEKTPESQDDPISETPNPATTALLGQIA